ncbi:hypothetical protein LTR56_005090 [Elasticomyces elasticus]|nr:hypothetical protein LTR56_005090 [Elasticomyces elasticus]KAK4921248.1 putative secondary metabolism biosynthetic enzyme [Elasticomyces elasticus]KAK5748109.1 putative secondary metabolism biosynthetic enzyme [Elasticomyces elasticus]
MNTYVNSQLEMMYESYDGIAPQKYAGKLKGKVALITGTSSGIGRSIAKAFASAGASVALVARREPELLSLVDEITAMAVQGKAVAIVADVLGHNAGPEIVRRVEEALGPVDILINNAGITRISPISVEDMERWWRVYEVNVLAPVSLCNAVLPSMVERQTGVLISTGSYGQLDSPAMSAYISSKIALSKFHELLATELEAESPNTSTFSVHPGFIWTGIGTRPDEVNNAQMKHPAMQSLFSMFGSMDPATMKMQTPQLCADTMVALAADPAYKILTGRHINSTQPLPSILDEAQKEGKGRLGSERLHLVNITSL